MTEIFQYDVFISHSTKDKAAVRDLASRLKSDGLRVWLDEWEIQPGDMIGLKIEQGLEQSRTLILIMSVYSLASEWVTLERHTALFRDPTNYQRRFIPLRLDDVEIKDTLRQFAYVDWRQRSAEQYSRLLAVCHPLVVEVNLSIEQQAKQELSKALGGENTSSLITSVATTRNGRYVVSGHQDKAARLWDVETGELLGSFKGHARHVTGVALTEDGERVVTSSLDKTVRLWDSETGKCLATLEGHTDLVWDVAVTPDGRRVVSVSTDKTVRVWNVETATCIGIFEGHTDRVVAVAVSEDGRRVASGSADMTVRVWDVEAAGCLGVLKGHTDIVRGVAMTADGQQIVSGSDDATVRLWDSETGKCLATLEGHTDLVWDVAVTPDGRRVVSVSTDKTVRVWNVETATCIGIFEGHTDRVVAVAVSEDGRRVASGSHDSNVRVWDVPSDGEKVDSVSGATLYTNAKVLLVGDTGVGKSALANRITGDCFEPTISTDAAWATQLKLPHETVGGDTEREIWLWDFAGQADYRLIHQLFMDETALAVFVFNPQSDNPFEGLGQWDRDLQRAARRPFKKLLVAGRCDRGGLMISRASIERFCSERSFVQYLETSAYTGEGCPTLCEAIIRNIPWNNIPWTASPHIFKLLKEEIVKLKDEGKALLRIGELKQQLEMRLPGEVFTLEQLRAVVGLLASPGIVWQLEFGDFILLHPERINAYAAAVIRKVRAHTDEIGVIPEEDVLAGRLNYQDMKRLPPDEEQIVLRAMHQTFIDHGLCIREATETGTLLVFPSYFKRERTELEGHPAVFVTYHFNGNLDEIYSTLVVRLHHTPAFVKNQLWRFAADFKTLSGKRAGLKMTKQSEGAGEISVYFEPGVPDETKVTFIKYIHEHLKMKAQDVIRLRYYVCTNCGTPVENRKTALDRLNRGQKDIPCVDCERRVQLWDLIEQKFASEEFQQRVLELEAQARTGIENESRELILIGHAFAIAEEAGQIFRSTPDLDQGIDAEIEFKNDQGQASGRRVYLQFMSSDSYLRVRKVGSKEIFRIKKPQHAEYWIAQRYLVMLVIRTSDGQIRWMNVTDYLNQYGTKIDQITLEGKPFTALNVLKLRDRLFL